MTRRSEFGVHSAVRVARRMLFAAFVGLALATPASFAQGDSDDPTAHTPLSGQPHLPAALEHKEAHGDIGKAYLLGSGDKVRVTVYGEEDLSGDFEVDGSGNVALPLVGQIHATGLSLRDFQSAVEQKLGNRYLVNPRVSAQVVNYRPFSILGEVNRPGEYPYESGMTVLNAVALGGGFTYRANEEFVHVRRKGAPKEERLPVDDRTQIYPGDTVRVDERLF